MGAGDYLIIKKITDVVGVIGLELFLKLLFLFVQLGGDVGLVLLGLNQFGLLQVLLLLLFLLLQCVQVLASLSDVLSQHSLLSTLSIYYNECIIL